MTAQDEETRDGARWDAVEEATELLVEGEHQRVLEVLKDVIAQDAGNAYAYHYLGTALFELERYDAARDAFRAAVLVSNEYLGARVGLVHALRMMGEGDEAVTEANVALGMFPDDSEALFALGLAQAAAGQRSAAARTLERFLTTTPEVEVQLDTLGIIDLLRQAPEGEPLIWK